MDDAERKEKKREHNRISQQKHRDRHPDRIKARRIDWHKRNPNYLKEYWADLKVNRPKEYRHRMKKMGERQRDRRTPEQNRKYHQNFYERLKQDPVRFAAYRLRENAKHRKQYLKKKKAKNGQAR